ncbi:receptor-type tyrosine-protein phosphatase eta [Xenopus tropicalis]|uniref:Receptor-type tyrosine-protein phosphatase eta n=1 Tax=Xenopus tropicalis TaxID=8364 RepID=A0A8J1JL32_XENTR|nr:receptor-type tyrosine-protein phosphatase eta [Xenopus tropicalis]
MVPGGIKNLTIVCVTEHAVSLSWLPPEGNFSSYIFRIEQFPTFNSILNIENVTTDNLTPGNLYTFYISAVVGDSFVEGKSSTISTYMVPGGIKNLTIVCVTEHTVSLSWQPPEGNFSSYIFRIEQFPTFNSILNVENVTTDNLTPGNLYTFYISAVVGDSFVEGKSSTISTYMVPGGIKNLTIVCVTEHTVSLSWQPPEGNFSSYIFRIEQFPTFNSILNVENVTTDNLTPGNLYTFYISAVVGDSFVEGKSSTISTYMVPGGIKNLTIVCVTEHTVSLSWQPPEGNFSSYIFRIEQFPTFNSILNVENVTTDNLTPGNLYTFYISAVVGDSFVEGKSSTISTYMVPGRIRNLTIVCVTEHAVSLSWQPPEGNFSSYIFRIEQFPTFNSILNVENVTTDNLTPGNFYTFYISAVVGDSFVEGYRTAISTYLGKQLYCKYNLSKRLITTLLRDTGVSFF